jgi:ABC-type multidrug transport system fused ATPase/permease subunit
MISNRRARAWRRINDLTASREPEGDHGRADMGRLWNNYLQPRAGLIVLASFFTLVTSAGPFGFPVMWRFLIDHALCVGSGGISPDALSHHARLVGIFFIINMCIWTFQLSGGWFAQRILAGIGRQLVYRLRQQLHSKLQALHIGFFDRTPVGIIMSRVLDDVSVIHQWVTRGGQRLIDSLLKIPIGLGLLLYLRGDLALMVMLLLPLYAFTFARLRPMVRRCHEAMRRLNARKYARSTERISAVAVVKAFGQETAETRKFARMSHDTVRVALLFVFYQQCLAVLVALITACATGMAVYIGGVYLRSGVMTLGDVIAFLGVTRALFMPVRMLTNLATAVQRVLVVLRRVFRLLDEPVALKSGSIDLKGMKGSIEFDHVTFSHPGHKEPVLKDVSFMVCPGQRVAVMGPSGTGKSTVFDLLLRFYDPDGGEVRVGGVTLTEADTSSLRDHVHLVQQEPVIFSGSIFENISYGELEADSEAISRAARQAELHDFVDSLPLGYDTAVGENGITLSGGQKQRLALATALLTDPEILLLDDTTSALDPTTEKRIRETLNRVLPGRTSLIITQRIATAQPCDRIIVLEDGRVTQEGTHDELIKQDGFYRRICIKQGIAAG